MDHIIVNEHDHVVVVLRDYQAGEQLQLDTGSITLLEDVKRGHKVAREDIKNGSPVHKYGFPIGFATTDIKKGAWIHTHNIKTTLEGTLNYNTFTPNEVAVSTSEQVSPKTFQGYVRKNGDVGIRNEIWIVNTVGCINKTAEVLARQGDKMNFEGVDAVSHFPHPFGCSQLGDDLQATQKILSNLVAHPNAAGVLVLGLGCENNYIDAFKQVIGDYDPDRVKFLSVQQVSDELEAGMDLIEELATYAATFKREAVPVSKLKVGLKCGGSDGLSGITANPLVGTFSDKLISHGGSTVLTEVPEMFGAETILMDRAADEEVFTGIVDMVNGFKDYFIRHDQVVYENPSPGNKEGGITTLEEKSLGCVQKGGFAPVVDVLPYGGRLKKNGLSLLQGPGNDLVSVTALAASGAHIVLFTTGRGTPFGGPVPTVKMSTNTPLFERKKNWIDFNAGELVQGKKMEDVSEELLDYVLDLASGDVRTHNEKHGFKEIALFKDGVIL
ncbi:altronate dehydratase family protein [Alkalicoccobacillus gibsonii]|uniref:Altronate dehydratase family protein n=1 Tax=Alkalicoccobacillus gibsonii TaxID=79881 RepID=A0ABU9VEP3_9BACI